jgi:hypothetical protein
MADNSISSTTQQYLDIHDITNDLVVMKDGTTSLILSVDAMNFGLLAEEEQDSIIYAYAGLLNSLNYPIQILVRSQTKDVTSYLRRLQEQENATASPEKRSRIMRYREFVSNLIHERNVLDKKFYVVIPAGPLELGLLSAQSVIPGQKTFDVTQVERSVLLEKARNILEPKRDHLISQFARIGLYSRQLATQEIIQLFYLSYNPEAAEGQEIAESNSYTTPLVKASFEGRAMMNSNFNNQSDQPVVVDGATTPGAPAAPSPVPPVQNEPTASIEQPLPPPAQPAPPVQPEPPASPAPQETPVEPTAPEASPQPTQDAPTTQPAQPEPVIEQTLYVPPQETELTPNQEQPVQNAPAGDTGAPTAKPNDEEVAKAQTEINQTLGEIGAAPAVHPAPGEQQSPPALEPSVQEPPAPENQSEENKTDDGSMPPVAEI